MRDQMTAGTRACADCPWRKSNQGKRHPHGWFSKKNLRRLWNGIRTGNAPGMTCHPTDTGIVVPEAWPVQAKPGTTTKECAGALLLVQRELRSMEQPITPASVDAYKARRRGGLTNSGILWWAVSRCALANTPLGGPSMPVIDEDPEIGFEDMLP